MPGERGKNRYSFKYYLPSRGMLISAFILISICYQLYVQIFNFLSCPFIFS
jgi:hypothetical protein